MKMGLALAALLALPQVAAAQEVESDPARMCSVTGGFGETFGATQLAGKARFETEYAIYFTPRKRYPPFVQSHESYSVGVTAKGRRIFRVTTSVFYTSYAAADAGYRLIGSQIAAGGWTRTGEKDDMTVFVSDAANPEGGVHIELQKMGSRVFMECIDTRFLETVQEEAYGPPDPATRRPEPPARPPIAALPAESDCTLPARRDAILADAAALADQLRDYGQPALRHAARLADWKAGQLMSRGVWTGDDRLRFSQTLLADPAFGQESGNGLAQLQKMMGFMREADDAGRRGDPASQCVADVRMLAALGALIGAAEAQWEIVDRAYAREAARLGVTLD